MKTIPIDAKKLAKEGQDYTGRERGRTQEEVLNYLKENKGSAFTQQELAEELDITPQQVNSVVRALEKKGVVERKVMSVEEGGRSLVYNMFAGEKKGA